MQLNDFEKVAAIIADSGCEVVGRTRLQKIAYLLTVAGMESGFVFGYKHYGPYSEDFANAASLGALLGYLSESEHQANWGGSYSIYQAERPQEAPIDDARRRFAGIAADADAIELELAATAVFLSLEGYDDPWFETARRKPDKAQNGRLDRAKLLLRSLSNVPTPEDLPEIV